MEGNISGSHNISGAHNNAAICLNALAKVGEDSIEDAKIRGKKEVYQDTLNWMLKKNGGDLKFVRVDELLEMLKGENPNARTANFTTKRYKPASD